MGKACKALELAIVTEAKNFISVRQMAEEVLLLRVEADCIRVWLVRKS